MTAHLLPVALIVGMVAGYAIRLVQERLDERKGDD